MTCQNLVTEEVFVPLTFLQIVFFNLCLLLFFAPLFVFSPPLLKAGLIWAQIVEDFGEIISDSFLKAVIPQILGNMW